MDSNLPAAPALPAEAPAAPAWADAAREAAFAAWLAPLVASHGLLPQSLCAASADASFRRYFRIRSSQGRSLVVMDAPPPQEDVRPFVDIARRAHNAGLPVPRVLAEDLAQGFLLLDDFGPELLLSRLQQQVAAGQQAAAERQLREAVSLLVRWQAAVPSDGLPAYDDALLQRELSLFPEWCVAREFGVVWTAEQQAQWQTTCGLLVRSALAQPTVAVHRDYMPRNLMLLPAGAEASTGAQGPLGILDFQDAVRGPISYDPASLLRDAFISWEEEVEIDLAVRYWEQARKAGLPVPADDFGEFWRQLEWMGLQRHLKVLGIFCRLKWRDNKPRYSEDLPRFFRYVHRVASRYQGLGPLAHLVEPLMGMRRIEAYY